MTAEDWINLIGKTSQEDLVKLSLRSFGFRDKLAIPRDETDLIIEHGGVTVEFQDESFFPDLPEPAGEGVGVLTRVSFLLRDPNYASYTGPLPLGLSRDDSRSEVRAKLGEPVRVSGEYLTEFWRRDGLQVTLGYLEGFSQIESVHAEMLTKDEE